MNETIQKLLNEFKGETYGVEILPYINIFAYLIETEQREELNTRLNDLKETGLLSEECLEKINNLIV